MHQTLSGQWRDASGEVVVNGVVLSRMQAITCHVATDASMTDSGVFCGTTTWSWPVNSRKAMISWPWTELRPGVVMISDPNLVVWSVRFVHAPGAPTTRAESMILVNRIIHAVEWQPTVQKVASSYRCKPIRVSTLH